MFGFDPLTVSAVMVLASAGAGGPCSMAQPAKIHVTPSTQDVNFVTNMTLAQMQNQKTDTINPHSFNGVSVTQGYAEGAISIKASVSLDAAKLHGVPAACLWYKQINVGFDIEPNVYIAKEVYQDLCMRKAVMAHEMKHVNTDKKVVNSFSQHIGQKLYSELKTRGLVVGPVPLDQVQSVADRMKQTALQIIEMEQTRFTLLRRDAQAQIDTKEEYDRVAAQCPHFRLPR